MELKLNLRNNSYDYLINAIDMYEKSVNFGDYHLTSYYDKLKLKISFLLLSQSYELLLKSVLYDKQEKLIYKNIDLENFDNANTVNFMDAVNRVNNFTDYEINKENRNLLKKGNEIRNKFIHFEVNISFEKLRKNFLDLFIQYDKLHSHFYKSYIKLEYLDDIKLEKQINFKKESILNDNNFIIFRDRDFLKEDLPSFKKLIEENKSYNFYTTNKNKKYNRIPMGQENTFFESIGKYELMSDLYDREYCHDCLAKIGEYHLFEYHCDLEVCQYVEVNYLAADV